jgi:hypothetical protein
MHGPACSGRRLGSCSPSPAAQVLQAGARQLHAGQGRGWWATLQVQPWCRRAFAPLLCALLLASGCACNCSAGPAVSCQLSALPWLSPHHLVGFITRIGNRSCVALAWCQTAGLCSGRLPTITEARLCGSSVNPTRQAGRRTGVPAGQLATSPHGLWPSPASPPVHAVVQPPFGADLQPSAPVWQPRPVSAWPHAVA